MTHFLFKERPKAAPYRGESLTWIEHKMDGKRLSIYKDQHGVITARGRKLEIDDWPKLKHQEFAEKIEALPYNTFIDGELHPTDPKVNATKVPTLLNEGEGLSFTAFAAPLFDGSDIRFSRLATVRSILRDWWLTVPPLYPPLSVHEGVYELPVGRETVLKAAARELGIEGFVVKTSHWYSWFKIKPSRTIDCIITAVYPGGSGTKYANTFGAFGIGFIDSEEICRVGSGFSDEQRKSIWESQPVGQVVEIEYDKVETRGGLRFPRFVRLRDDKPIAECTKDQLED